MSGLPITVTPGTYTPGAQTALDMAAALVNTTWEEAQKRADAFATKVGEVEAFLPNPNKTASALDIQAASADSPAVVEPVVDIPESIAVDDVMALFDTKYQELVALLVDKFTVFQTTYFPDDSAAYTATQNWLLATLADPSITPPANVVALDNELSGFISDPTVDDVRVESLNTWLAAYINTPAIQLTSDLSTLNTQLSGFISVPTVSEAGLTELSTALFSYINNPSSPIPMSVLDQIWENSRSQVTREKLGSIDAAFRTFAARRFPLPPGALNAAILSIEQGAQDKLATASREAAIKGVDMAYDKVKFASTQAQDLHKTLAGLTEDKLKMAVAQAQSLRQSLFDAQEKRLALCVDTANKLQTMLTTLDADKLKMAVAQAQSLRMAIFDAQEKRLALAVDKLVAMRQLALNSAVEYIKALASGPDMASRLVGIGYDAQSKLISSASQFYGVRKEVAQLATQNNQFNVTSSLQAAEKNQGKDMSLIEDRVKAMEAEAMLLGQSAAALLNNLHASAGTSYGVSIS